jgi:hypothetical protein
LAHELQALECRLLKALRLEAQAQQHLLEMRVTANQERAQGGFAVCVWLMQTACLCGLRRVFRHAGCQCVGLPRCCAAPCCGVVLNVVCGLLLLCCHALQRTCRWCARPSTNSSRR